MIHNLANFAQAVALVLTYWALPALLIVATYIAGTRGARALARVTVCRGRTTRDRRHAARAAAKRRHPAYRGVTRVETYRDTYMAPRVDTRQTDWSGQPVYTPPAR